MKLKLLVSIFFACFYFCLYQVGIGTVSPDESSIVDVESTTKGFFIGSSWAVENVDHPLVNGIVSLIKSRVEITN